MSICRLIHEYPVWAESTAQPAVNTHTQECTPGALLLSLQNTLWGGWESYPVKLSAHKGKISLVVLTKVGGFSGETPEEPGKQRNLTPSFPKGPVCSPRGLAIARGLHPTFLGLPQGRLSTALVVWLLRHVQLFATLWTVARPAPLSMGFSRQQYWSGVPSPSPGDLPDPRIEPGSPMGRRMLYHWATWEAINWALGRRNSKGRRDLARRGRTEKLKGE